VSSGADKDEILWEWVEEAKTTEEELRRLAVADGDQAPTDADQTTLWERGYYFPVRPKEPIPTKESKHHPLYEIYEEAVAQACVGKGNDRHGMGKSFYDQKWAKLADIHGVGFLSGQAQKKLEEAFDAYRQGNCDMVWFEKELMGSLNYVAMSLLYLRRKENR
jgi:nucleoside 2-deoxyribosyltransferase